MPCTGARRRGAPYRPCLTVDAAAPRRQGQKQVTRASVEFYGPSECGN